MYQSARNDSPFDDPSLVLFSWRRARRLASLALLAAAAVVLFVDVVGEPLLRWEYQYRGSYEHPVILDATYVGFSGLRRARFEQAEHEYPVLAFAKPETPLWRQLLSRATNLLP